LVTLRASQIGGCVRQQVYRAMGLPWTDLRPEKSRRMMAMGQLIEHLIFQEVYSIYEQVQPKVKIVLTLDREGEHQVVITGTPDHVELIGLNEEGDPVQEVYEAKSMHSFAFKLAKQEGLAIKYPQYLWQVAVYTVGTGSRGAEIVMWDRVAGSEAKEYWTLEMLHPYWMAASTRAQAIYYMATRRVLPERDPKLPEWACLVDYCGALECKYRKEQRNGDDEKPKFKGKGSRQSKVVNPDA
jgi:hypothetical protein